MLPNVARYQLRHTPINIQLIIQAQLSACLLFFARFLLQLRLFFASLKLAKLLPLLLPRFIRHRRRFGNVPNCATLRKINPRLFATE